LMWTPSSILAILFLIVVTHLGRISASHIPIEPRASFSPGVIRGVNLGGWLLTERW